MKTIFLWFRVVLALSGGGLFLVGLWQVAPIMADGLGLFAVAIVLEMTFGDR